jgi:5-methylcytosine-specific restriction endonuclease McrA
MNASAPNDKQPSKPLRSPRTINERLKKVVSVINLASRKHDRAIKRAAIRDATCGSKRPTKALIALLAEKEKLARVTSTAWKAKDRLKIIQTTQHKSRDQQQRADVRRLPLRCEFPELRFRSAYLSGCRCRRCVGGIRAYMREYMRSRRNRIETGTAERDANLRRTQQWRQANPELHLALTKANSARRRCRVNATIVSDRRLMTAILSACPPGMQVDHINPLANGGTHEVMNLQYLESKHNRRKGKKQGFSTPDAATCRWQDVPLLVAAYLHVRKRGNGR